MKLKITVHGVAYEVDVEVLDPGEGFPASASLPKMKPKSQKTVSENSQSLQPSSAASPGVPGGSVTSPIAGTILEIKCKEGDVVAEGQVLFVIEAMKMKTSIAAPTGGTIKSIPVAAGDNVQESQILVVYK